MSGGVWIEDIVLFIVLAACCLRWGAFVGLLFRTWYLVCFSLASTRNALHQAQRHCVVCLVIDAPLLCLRPVEFWRSLEPFFVDV